MKKKFIDLSGICICLAVIGITSLYADQVRGLSFYRNKLSFTAVKC